MVLKKVNIYTDGACSGNPGIGGWAAILRYNGNEKRISGFVKNTTNNRMELLALINSLGLLKECCDITVFSDSKYVVDSICRGWAESWKKSGWIRKKKLVPNSDLWQVLLKLISNHKVSLNWVRGHSGHSENEECDKMAVAEIQNYKDKLCQE